MPSTFESPQASQRGRKLAVKRRSKPIVHHQRVGRYTRYLGLVSLESPLVSTMQLAGGSPDVYRRLKGTLTSRRRGNHPSLRAVPVRHELAVRAAKTTDW